MKIAICASMSFSQEILQIKSQLEALSHTVFVPTNTELYVSGETKVEWLEEKIKYDLIRHYYNIIKDCDAVLVLNLDKNGIKNYIGWNSLLEMGFAYVNYKKIFLYNPIPAISYSDEIVAMLPVVIDQDLKNI